MLNFLVILTCLRLVMSGWLITKTEFCPVETVTEEELSASDCLADCHYDPDCVAFRPRPHCGKVKAADKERCSVNYPGHGDNVYLKTPPCRDLWQLVRIMTSSQSSR